MADFSAVYNSVPPVTRTILLSMAVVTFPCLIGIVQPATVALSWRQIVQSFQIWRPVTSFFFGGTGFPLLYDFFLVFRNSSSMEMEVYRGDTAEYAWVHVMLGVFIIIFNTPIGLPFLFRPLLHAQTYMWCRVNPNVKVSIFGLLTIPTSLYPTALILLDLLTGGPMKAISGVLGLLAGHLWWFLSTYLPFHSPSHLRRPNPLSVPLLFRSLFARELAAPTSTSQTTQHLSSGTSTARFEATPLVRHRWGGGQRLGGDAL